MEDEASDDKVMTMVMDDDGVGHCFHDDLEPGC